MDLMSARGYAELREVLAETYTPEGVEIWLSSRHRQFDGLTVDEMMDADRDQEVIDLARSLTGQVAT